MPFRCENCQSLFFKTLETRVLAENASILYKKRCKRCKFKYLIRKDVVAGRLQPASYEEWTLGSKIKNQSTYSKKVSERGRIFVSEYTERISRPAEEPLPYLQKIRQAQTIHQSNPQNTGGHVDGQNTH
jgi:hypothetical protein